MGAKSAVRIAPGGNGEPGLGLPEAPGCTRQSRPGSRERGAIANQRIRPGVKLPTQSRPMAGNHASPCQYEALGEEVITRMLERCLAEYRPRLRDRREAHCPISGREVRAYPPFPVRRTDSRQIRTLIGRRFGVHSCRGEQEYVLPGLSSVPPQTTSGRSVRTGQPQVEVETTAAPTALGCGNGPCGPPSGSVRFSG
jgi:hypothetical protein